MSAPLTLSQGLSHHFPEQQADLGRQDPKPLSCISLHLDQSGGLHSGAAQYWLEEVRGRRVMQRTRHPWSSQSLSKGCESPGAGLHGAQAVLYKNKCQSHGAGFADLPSSMDSSSAVPSGTSPQWFIDSFLPPTAPLRPCTHNMWQLIGIC